MSHCVFIYIYILYIYILYIYSAYHDQNMYNCKKKPNTFEITHCQTTCNVNQTNSAIRLTLDSYCIFSTRQHIRLSMSSLFATCKCAIQGHFFSSPI